MTGHQASPAHAELPAPAAATARPHDPAGHHAIGRRRAALLLAAAQKKTALYAPVLLGAADTFRAAAVEQLSTWGERAGAEVVRGVEGADPASVAFDAVKRGSVAGSGLAGHGQPDHRS